MSYTIAIIGSGNIGQGLAIHLATTGNRVLLANRRGPESISQQVQQIGGSLEAAGIDQALEQADVVFIAVPWTSVEEVARGLSHYQGKVIVDATNNIVSVNPFTLANIDGKSTGEYNAGLFSGHRLVKAFNTLGAATLARSPKNSEGDTVMVFSGDDSHAKETVSGIIKEMGFAPIDLGSLKDGKLQDIGGALSGIRLIHAGR